MTKLQQLIEAANKAQDIQDAYPGQDYRMSVNATTILELCALLEKAEDALKNINEYWCGNRNDLAMFDACNNAVEVSDESLAAIKQWKEGHEASS